MAAPTLVSTTHSTNFGVSSTAKSTPAVSWNAGDLIVVTAITGDNTITLTNPPTATGLTFAILTGYPTNTASRMKHYVWQATAGAGGSQAIAATASIADFGGLSVRVWRNHNGVGAIGTPVQAQSITLTTTGANSAIDAAWSSWNQATGARTYLTTVATPTEDGYIDNGTYGTSGWFYHPDAGAAGSKNVGLSAPTLANNLFTAIEILAAAAAAPLPDLVMGPPRR